jgi:hypothetical protein
MKSQAYFSQIIAVTLFFAGHSAFAMNPTNSSWWNRTCTFATKAATGGACFAIGAASVFGIGWGTYYLLLKQSNLQLSSAKKIATTASGISAICGCLYAVTEMKKSLDTLDDKWEPALAFATGALTGYSYCATIIALADSTTEPLWPF